MAIQSYVSKMVFLTGFFLEFSALFLVFRFSFGFLLGDGFFDSSGIEVQFEFN